MAASMIIVGITQRSTELTIVLRVCADQTDGERREQTNNSAHQQPFDSFHAGYLRIDEDHLYRTGVRGCKKYVLYCIVAFLFIATLGNLILTVCVIGSFRISYEGAEAFEFVPPGILWRVFYDVDTKSVALSGKGKLGGRAAEHLPIDAYDSSVHINSKSGEQSKISVEPNGTTLTAERLSIVHPKTSQVLFSSDSVTDDILSKSHEVVSFVSLTTSRLSSKVDEPLRVESDRAVYLTGMEGMTLEGANITMEASDAITLSSADGSVSVSGPEGISISTNMKTYPFSAQTTAAYKICVCAGSGLVFLSSPGTGCVIKGVENPCIV
ncbi:beta-sarcoglycan-like [Liolophura sinensis]|uniref:beta-sarcoglycan-like n=1 Tax=Liolophura sinensis TaxID=3198878 RepID=UPI0031585224